MQMQSTQASRDQSSAAAIPSKVGVPSRPAPNPKPDTGNGHQPGSGIKGFGGALKPGKC